jgi:uncharacterized oligopeptide transporter (OPT) family protein
VRRARTRARPAAEAEDWKRTNTRDLSLWVAFWAIASIAAASGLLGIPVFYAALGVALSFVFVLVNGISMGISDSNPLSSAFVVAVTLMAAIGLTDPLVGLVAGSILLITTNVGGDMQQDRSTGWRLGTNRMVQFRYQVIGIVMGALLAVYVAKLFLAAYPVLAIDTFAHPEQKAANWQSAMTYKLVGVLRGLTSSDPTSLRLMLLGIAIGFSTEVVRKLLKASAAYQAWKAKSSGTRAADFVVDAILLPSPYASSFGGFVDWFASFWVGLGGIFSSSWNWVAERMGRSTRAEGVPADISTMSLLGGGLIAGEALAFLTLGIIGLLTLL